MTKKDYELIAKGISNGITRETALNNVIVHSSDCNYRIAKTAWTLAYLLKEENPRFDAMKFFKACEMVDSDDGVLKSELLTEVIKGQDSVHITFLLG